MKPKCLVEPMEPVTEEETELLAEQFLDDWELKALLINDEKMKVLEDENDNRAS